MSDEIDPNLLAVVGIVRPPRLLEGAAAGTAGAVAWLGVAKPPANTGLVAVALLEIGGPAELVERGEAHGLVRCLGDEVAPAEPGNDPIPREHCRKCRDERP